MVRPQLPSDPDAERALQSMPSDIEIGGERLFLNGSGFRVSLMFRVYALGLYVAHVPPLDRVEARRDARVVREANVAKQIRLVMTRDLEVAPIRWAFRSAAERAAGDRYPFVRARVETLLAAVTDARRGDELVLTYDPRTSVTRARWRGGLPIEIAGADVAAVLFGIWLGEAPVDPELRTELLRSR